MPTLSSSSSFSLGAREEAIPIAEPKPCGLGSLLSSAAVKQCDYRPSKLFW